MRCIKERRLRHPYDEPRPLDRTPNLQPYCRRPLQRPFRTVFTLGASSMKDFWRSLLHSKATSFPPNGFGWASVHRLDGFRNFLLRHRLGVDDAVAAIIPAGEELRRVVPTLVTVDASV